MTPSPDPLAEVEVVLAEIVALKDRESLAPGEPDSQCQAGWWLAVGYISQMAKPALRSVRLARRRAAHQVVKP